VTDRIGEHVQGQLGARVASGGGCLDVAQVAKTTQPLQARMLGQIVKKLRQGLPGGPHQYRQGKRVEVAHAIILRQAALWAHAQAVRHGLA